MTGTGWWAEVIADVPAAELTITGGTPAVTATAHHFLSPAGASIGITGGYPLLAGEVRPAGASLAIAGGTPSVNVGRLLQPSGASLTTTGGTPNVIRGNILRPSGASLAATGGTPTVTVAAPTAFNAVGGGFASNSDPSYSITVSANAYVVVFVAVDRNNAVTAITCGGTAMTLLSTQAMNNDLASGYLSAYGIQLTTAGSKTVSATITSAGSSWEITNAVSYTSVVSTSATTAAGSGSPSISGSVISGQMLVSAISRWSSGGSAALTPSGGTSRYNSSAFGVGMSIRDSTSGFTHTSTGTSPWAGIAVVLSPF